MHVTVSIKHFKVKGTYAQYLECSFCRLDKLCRFHHKSPAQKCGCGNQNEVALETVLTLPVDNKNIQYSIINIQYSTNSLYGSTGSAKPETSIMSNTVLKLGLYNNLTHYQVLCYSPPSPGQPVREHLGERIMILAASVDKAEPHCLLSCILREHTHCLI